jgi:endonuclease G
MRQIESVRKFGSQFDSTLAAVQENLKDTGIATSPALDAVRGERPLESLGAAHMEATLALEAIILERMRPAYFIRDNQIVIKGEYDHQDLIVTNKLKLEQVALNVARVDLFHHPTLSYAGTGWMIDKDIAVTNRHVARIFAQADGMGGYDFSRGTFGESMEARLDYTHQDQSNLRRRRADVLEVLYIAGDAEPDMALLKVDARADTEALPLFTGKLEEGTPIAAIGYPAWDGDRNDPLLMKELFGGIYDVKRFSPGLLTAIDKDGIVILADYTSLGGNSGSPVIRLDTGEVLGLHFAGAFRDSNYAVAADIVAAAKMRMQTRVTVLAAVPEEAPVTRADKFAGRTGYDPEFLGAGDLAVPLPGLGDWAEDVAPVSDDENGVLKYQHFSVIQSASRRLPLVTAVNIDGSKSIRIKRAGDWALDGRIALEHQIGNELYAKNAFDRGHMVRRRDPGWGDNRAEAERGELDTFHYTNSAPQHEDLNQREWLRLEDYILENSETRDFKCSVFTGPVFRETDKRLKKGVRDVQIPEEFWKIAVMVNEDTGELSATGYVLSQGKMIRKLTEAQFLFGKFKTYQVPIRRIEEATGLDFGALRSFDPLDSLNEAPFSQSVIVLENDHQPVLSKKRLP